MTIRVTTWCETCEEECRDHPSVCTVCGTALAVVTPPSSNRIIDHSPVQGSMIISPTTTTDSLRDILGDMRQAGRDLRDVLGSLRGQVQDLEALTRQILEQQQQSPNIIPRELWDPQGDGSSAKARPTSQKALDQLTRIVLDEKSTIFRQATLNVNMNSSLSDGDGHTLPKRHQFCATVAEFGPTNIAHVCQDAALVVASPLTGKGGLSETTVQAVRQQSKLSGALVYFQRGDGLTYVKKSLLAQEQGAVAVVIGNNTPSPWPYVMKDSKNEGQKCGLSIPVVMVKQADGQRIVQMYIQKQPHRNLKKGTNLVGSLHITSQSHDCVVCCERLQNSEIVVQLPGCGHIFHESCAMTWLTTHNTCPYCRRELPTDDIEYERERQRQQRTHAGSTSSTSSTWNEYYG